MPTSPKPYKTTKEDFERFKASFLHYQRLFNRMDYTAYFHHADLSDSEGIGSQAQAYMNHEGRVATVALNTRVGRKESFDPEICGKHEAIHLLIARLTWLGMCRYITESEITGEEEAVVIILENLEIKEP